MQILNINIDQVVHYILFKVDISIYTYIATVRRPHGALATLMGFLLRVFYVYRDCTATSRRSNHAHVVLTACLLRIS